MKLTNKVRATAIMGTLLVALSGCESNEGPAEEAGKKVDEATEQAGEKIEAAGEKIQDAAEGGTE
jgi:hypothetical protein